jgi:hypothetical protein
MQYVCDAGANTWFRIETVGEAVLESQAMNHAVDRYFKEAHDKAVRSYAPPASLPVIEQSIGLKGHVQRTMPVFVTLRDKDGAALVTGMLPPAGVDARAFRPVIVGPGNMDPFPVHGDAIRQLGLHCKLTLDPARCYPYQRN